MVERPCVKHDYEMAVATETVGLEMTVTSVICPVLWAAGIRVEAMATLMALHPNFWKILELTDPFTQGKWPILFWKFEQILSGILFQFLQPRNMDTKRAFFENPNLLGLCRHIGQIFFWAFWVFSAKLQHPSWDCESLAGFDYLSVFSTKNLWFSGLKHTNPK